MNLDVASFCLSQPVEEKYKRQINAILQDFVIKE